MNKTLHVIVDSQPLRGPRSTTGELYRRKMTMKIEFTKDEYRVLLDIVYLANWVVNSFKISDECTPEFEALKSKVFSFARRFGFDGFVERNGVTEEFMESRAFEDSVEEKGYVSEYDDYTFWQELVSRLACKYLLEVLGEEKYRSLSQERRFMMRIRMEERVQDVIDREGLHGVFLRDFNPRGEDL